MPVERQQRLLRRVVENTSIQKSRLGLTWFFLAGVSLARSFACPTFAKSVGNFALQPSREGSRVLLSTFAREFIQPACG